MLDCYEYDYTSVRYLYGKCTVTILLCYTDINAIVRVQVVISWVLDVVDQSYCVIANYLVH